MTSVPGHLFSLEPILALCFFFCGKRYKYLRNLISGIIRQDETRKKEELKYEVGFGKALHIQFAGGLKRQQAEHNKKSWKVLHYIARPRQSTTKKGTCISITERSQANYLELSSVQCWLKMCDLAYSCKFASKRTLPSISEHGK